MWEEIRAIFKVNTQKHPFYWTAHAILILVFYEVLINTFGTPRVSVYNGADFWFVFLHNFLAPFGTLMVSAIFIIKFILPIYQDWNGIKNTKEKKADKAVIGAFVESRGGPLLMKAEGIKPPPPAPKAKFRPDWLAFFRLVFEGLLYGAIIYLLLRFPVFDLAKEALDGEVYIPPAIDNNTPLRSIHTNPLQDIALAFGAAFYEEIIFRKYLYQFLFKRVQTRYLNYPSIPFAAGKPGASFLGLLPMTVAVVLGSVIYTLSHFLFPFGDNFSTYTVFYRFFFGIIMSIIFLWRGFAVAAWTHIWYDLFYFWFWVE